MQTGAPHSSATGRHCASGRRSHASIIATVAAAASSAHPVAAGRAARLAEVTTGGSVSSGVSEGGGGDSVTYATPVVRSLASTAPPVRIKKDGVNMAAGLVLSTTEKAAGVTVAVGGKYTVEDTTTLPAVTLLMITMSAVTPAEEAISCLKLLSNVLRAAGSARDDMSMAANVMVEFTVLTACWPAVDGGGAATTTVGGGDGGGDGGGEDATGGGEKAAVGDVTFDVAAAGVGAVVGRGQSAIMSCTVSNIKLAAQGREQLSALIASIAGQRDLSRTAPMTCAPPSKAKSGVNSVWSHAARQLRSEGDVRAHAGNQVV